MDTKKCYVCTETLIITDFVSAYTKESIDGTRNICKTCDKEKKAAYYYSKKDERTSEWYKIRNLKRDHNLTLKEFRDLVDKQDSVCAICGKGPNNSRTIHLHIDHDHNCCPSLKSCKLCRRGLLCQTCNIGLGHFKHSINLLKKAAEYLNEK